MTYITDEQQRIIKHQRIANTLIKDYFDDASNDAYKAVRSILLDFDALNPTIANMTQAQKLTVEAVQKALAPAFLSITDELDELAYNEVAFIAGALTNYTLESFTTPPDEKIKRYIDTSIMTLKSNTSVKAGRWEEFIERYIVGFEDEYKNIVTSSFAARRDNSQAAPTVTQTAKLLQERTGIQRKTALNLLSTGTAFYASHAKQAFRNDNADIIAREVPFVTFDNRTSNICISINMKYGGTGWPAGESPIGIPPYHFWCRTILLFMTKGQEKLMGNRNALGAVAGKEAQEAFELKKSRLRTKSQVTYSGSKDLNIFEPDKININTDFGTFLKQQPSWFIHDTLGKTLGDKFIAGDLDLTKLTDARLRPLKVSEL